VIADVVFVFGLVLVLECIEIVRLGATCEYERSRSQTLHAQQPRLTHLVSARLQTVQGLVGGEGLAR
jgi:hypothetical protein